MDIITIAGATNFLGAPENWDVNNPDVPCGVLPIRAFQEENRIYLRSEWRPTAEDLALLNAGGSIYLDIVGTAHPVVRMHAGEPSPPVTTS